MKTPKPSSLLRLCIAAAMIAAGTACSETPPSAPPVKSADPSASLGEQITLAIGDAACDNAQQCRTLPVGAKACGGPAGYLAWSTKRGNGELLARLAAQQAAEERKKNEKSGMMSTCSIELDPGATCSAGRCVLQKPGLGGTEAR